MRILTKSFGNPWGIIEKPYQFIWKFKFKQTRYQIFAKPFKNHVDAIDEDVYQVFLKLFKNQAHSTFQILGKFGHH